MDILYRSRFSLSFLLSVHERSFSQARWRVYEVHPGLGHVFFLFRSGILAAKRLFLFPSAYKVIFRGTVTTGAIIRVIFSILPCTSGYDGIVWACGRKKRKKKKKRRKRREKKKRVRWDLSTIDIANL